jgi:hypothetical protein
MTTRHFTLEELSAYLDGELDLDDAQRRHLADCAECARVLAGHQQLRRTARAAAPRVPTEEMWREIHARLAGAPERSGPARRPPWLLVGAGSAVAAAALLLVVALRESAPGGFAPRPPAAGPAGVPAAGPPANPPAPRTREERPAAAAAAAPASEGARPKEGPEAAAPSAKRDAGEATAPGSGAGERRQPSRVAAASLRADSPEPRRPVKVFGAFTISADRIVASDPNLISAAGRVVVHPARIGASYLATVDGVTRTVTGQLEGVLAEVLLPAERLILHTRAAPGSDPR